VSYLTPTKQELLEYLRNEYGSCTRPLGPNDRNDCFWGKNAQGYDDGCLKTGWKGAACPYWQPADEDFLDGLCKAYNP
jgi:hypothetical protein